MTRRAAPLWMAIAAGLTVLAGARVAEPHAFNPQLLELREGADGQVAVLWKVSAQLVGGRPRLAPGVSELRPRLDERCVSIGVPAMRRGAGSLTTTWQVDCGPEGLEATDVRVLGSAQSVPDVLVRVIRADGAELTAVLRSSDEALRVQSGKGDVAVGGVLQTLGVYGRLGVEHIGLGVDHLAFVLGLVLLVSDRRRLLWTITAFTAAHSVTLAATVLGLVRLPSAPVEAAIAVSIAWVAVELTRDRADTLGRRAPWAVAGAFGLLHGFAFAGALAEIGLPASQMGSALLGFNLGVELGQLGFVGVVLSAMALGRRLLRSARAERLAATATAYVIGGLAFAWTLDRVLSFWEVMG